MPNTFEQEPEQIPTGSYQPNIYPIIYWALLYGLLAGLTLFILRLLAQFVTLIWVPIFLAGAGWGAYRNYRKQKDEWANAQGVAPMKKSAVEEFKDAARDIAQASRTMLAEQAEEDRIAEEQAIAEQEVYDEAAYVDEAQVVEEEPQAPPAQQVQPPTPQALPQPPQPTAPTDTNTPNRPNLPSQ